jgi:hypothetical protein
MRMEMATAANGWVNTIEGENPQYFAQVSNICSCLFPSERMTSRKKPF